jgi:hypothetical protein
MSVELRALAATVVAFTPSWARTLDLGERSVRVYDGVAVFTAGRIPGAVVAIGEGRSLRLRVP